MNKDRIASLTLDALNLPPQTYRALLRLLGETEGRWLPYRKKRDLRRSLELVTAGEIMRVVEACIERERQDFANPPAAVRNFMKKLMELGLTRLDWWPLPLRTVTDEMLKALKKELLKKSVLVLGLSHGVLFALKAHYGPLSQVTVQMLLDTPSAALLDRTPHIGRGIFLARQRLRSLGLKKGLFLEEGSSDSLIQELMKEEGLDQEIAARVVAIAIKRQWIKAPPLK